ncbi:MAG: GntR family transcriptional regulator [Pikeienuella sp.]
MGIGPDSVNQVTKIPEHVAIYRRMRDMILFGEMAPGQPATIQGLTASIGAGMTPVREAIRRLTAEGALQSLGNRRICVPSLTLSTLDQIEYARLSIEPHIAALATSRATPEMIDELESIDEVIDTAIKTGDIQSYLENNYRFHFRIYEQSGADVLQQLALGMWLRMGPSLRVICARYGASNLPDQHDVTIDALRRGDKKAVSAALAADIRQGVAHIRMSLTEA